MRLSFKSLTLFIILLITSFSSQPKTHLSPLIPPTAFIGQYYTCQFRVLGMNFPIYQFRGLPPFLIASKDGRVEGLPNITGSYPITVLYRQNNLNNSIDIVIMVSSGFWPQFQLTNITHYQITTNSTPIYLYIKEGDTIAMIGTTISISLSATGGKEPYVWSFMRLPLQLTGDRYGQVRGTFYQEGTYSFGANCADSAGSSSDIFITLNIQPLIFFNDFTIPPVYVSQKDFPAEYKISQLTYIQKLTRSTFQKVFNETQIVRSKYLQLKKTPISQLQDQVKLAKLKVDTANWRVNNCLSNHSAISLIKMQLSNVLDSIRYHQKLANTSYQLNQKNMVLAQNEVSKQQTFVDSKRKNLQNLTSILIQSQKQSLQASADYTAAKFAVDDSRLSVNLTFDTVSQFKEILTRQTITLQETNNNVTMAKDQLRRVQLQNDQAQAKYVSANYSANNATSALEQANINVAQIRQQISDLQNDLGIANFNLTIANNNLLAAIARKQMADKAMERAQLFLNPKSNIPFKGCSLTMFPTISGTVVVTNIKDRSCQLASGMTLIWGDCTNKTQFSEGDLIYFQGKVKDGCIHSFKLIKAINSK